VNVNDSAVTHLFQEELYRFSTPVIVVLTKPWDGYTADEQLLLKKILTSVKLDINTVQMVVRPSLDIRSLGIYAPARVLIFGAEPNESLEMYQPVPAQGFIVIRANDLNQLDEDRKKNLWNALRRMFGPAAP